MTFALAGSTVTQTGTDTNWTGLSGIAGVTTVTSGDGLIYLMPGLILHIAGAMTIADPSKQTVVAFALRVLNGGNYRSGSFAADGVTPKTAGTHFNVVGVTSQFNRSLNSGSFEVQPGGQYRLVGGTYYVSGGICYMAGATDIQEFGVAAVASKSFGSSSTRIYYNTPNISKTDCKHYDLGIDLFTMPNTARPFQVKAFESEYVAQYVGGQFGGVDSQFKAAALSNADGTFDFDNYSTGWVELDDCALGANLKVVCQQNDANHIVPLFQNINFKVVNLAGTARNGVKFTCTDAPTNSPTVTITTRAGLKTWDFRSPLTYTGTTAGAGTASSRPVLQVWYGVGSLKNLRFPASTATYRFAGYEVIQQDVSIVLGSDTAINQTVAMTAATNLTLTQAQAAAITGIALTPVGASGGTITLTAPRTISQLWQYFRAWKPDNLASNEWTYDGTTLNVFGWTVVGAHNLSGGEIQTLTASASGVIANLIVIGDVTQTTPTDLSNVTITGTLTYATAVVTAPTFTNVTAGTVSNSGAAVIPIKRINSTLTAGTNVTSYVPTVLTLTLNGGRIRVLDNLGAEQFNQTTDATIELPAAATGAWTYAIRKYGQQPIVGGFTIDGTAKSIVAAYIPDTFVVAPEATAAAYTSLDSSQQIYDYLSLYGATAAGIVFGSVASKGFGTLTVPAGLTLNPSAGAIIAIAAGAVTTKTAGLAESVTLISSGNIITAAATLSAGVAIRGANLDSELVYTVDALTFYPSQAARDSGATPGDTVTGGVYRFKLGAVVSGVTLIGTVYMRVTVGSTVLFAQLALASGKNILDLGVQTQLSGIKAQVDELAQVHGLIKGVNLVVGPASRVAGLINQTIAEASGVVTVSRN